MAGLIEHIESLETEPINTQGVDQSRLTADEPANSDDSPKCDTSALTNNKNPSATTAELITIFCNIFTRKQNPLY
jgi:hypothetical protein